jgi:hypothetical protein
MITFRLRDKHGATDPHTLVFFGDEVFDYRVAARMKMSLAQVILPTTDIKPIQTWSGKFEKVDNSHPLFGMVEKLQEVLGNIL